MKNIIQAVVEVVDSSEYYTAAFDQIKWYGQNLEARVKCCFHEDDTPSLHINRHSGAWFCHGCTACGRNIVSFHSLLGGTSHEEAAIDIYRRFVRPIVRPALVDKYHQMLLKTPSVLAYIAGRRVSSAVIARYKLGWTGTRISIPIMNELGLYENVKYYAPNAKSSGVPKMLNHRVKDDARKFGSPPALFPFDQLDEARRSESKVIFINEGEFDALTLVSLGIHAVTSTAGCKSWPKDHNDLFAGLHVAIAYDNDADGTKYRSLPTRNISKTARSIKYVDTPAKFGKDVNDWVRKDLSMRTSASWFSMLEHTAATIDNPHREGSEPDTVLEVSLDVASLAEYSGRKISVKSIVTGKDTAPYLVPKVYRTTCTKSCEDCPIADTEKDFLETQIDEASTDVIGFLDLNKQSLHKQLAVRAGFAAKPDCRCRIDVASYFNVESLLLIPTLDSMNGEYVRRAAFFVGHGLKSNRSYEFVGTTTPNPTDQHSTHLFTEARPIQDAVEMFQLNEDMKQALKIFQPPNGVSTFDHLTTIARWLSRKVTKIRQRDDLHILVDIVFHSVSGFYFNKELISRGMLDVLVIGDTRCGKGKVTESLVKYYGLGDVASGENCSFAGIIGGLQQAGTRWFVTWGLVPLNHGRLVVIDEASALSEDEIGHMSRVRSEGVAEISKIVRESTQASTRLIWLSNPRSGRQMATYNCGVEAIRELMGASEDVSRFDTALSVATNEVESTVINTLAVDPADSAVGQLELSQEHLRALVLWAWSRNRDQVVFTDAAQEEVIKVAIKFGKTYSPTIPLIQVENVRIKVAKISAATAARVFSTDDSCSKVVIKRQHVQCAERLMREAYAKPSMAYDRFSESSKRSTTVSDESVFDKVFAPLGKDRIPVIQGMLQLHKVTVDSVVDYVGDQGLARLLISELVKCHALLRIDASSNWYLKNPTFNQWLRSKAS